MTLPDERSRAIIRTEQFLNDIVARNFKRVPKEVREEAIHCLRHFPFRFEVNQIPTKNAKQYFAKVLD